MALFAISEWQPAGKKKKVRDSLRWHITKEDSGTGKCTFGAPYAMHLQGIQWREWKDSLLVWNFIMIDFDAETWLGRLRAWY